jgi:exosortase
MISAQVRRIGSRQAVIVSALVIVCLWVYWGTLRQLVRTWWIDPQYSHGYLVPVFALALCYFRRDRLKNLQPSAWAIALLAAGIGLRMLAAYFYLTWLDQVSLLPIVGAICLAVGGWPLLDCAWPGIAFLLFMIPLPGRLEGVLSDPLQRIATIGSTNVLQTLGFFAESEGNVIRLSTEDLGVVDACKGLHMLVVFFALSTGVAIISTRPLYQRAIVILSAIPIALLCNILRIAVTGVLYETTNPKLADLVFHDVAGWLMIPLALGFLALEFWLLDRIFVPVKEEAASVILGPEKLAPRKNGAAQNSVARTNGKAAATVAKPPKITPNR